MYCKKCGAELPQNAVFCPKCGMNLAEKEASPNDPPTHPSSTSSSTKLRCPKCHSYNVQVQAIEQPRNIKPYAFLGVLIGCFVGMCAGKFVGGFALGILGGIIGIVIGFAKPKKYKSVGVCQDCGYSSEIK